MPYSVTITPTTILKDETAAVAVTVPDAVDQQCNVELVRVNDMKVVGTGIVVLDLKDATVGLEGDPTDYFVRCHGSFKLAQTGPLAFALSYDPTVVPHEP